jgi:dihydroflavonol-4-reductase
MDDIDKSQPVLVTGATGYVAGWIVKRLVDDGRTVHAAVRDPSNREKVRHLDDLAAKAPGTIRYFKSDLLEPGSYAESMADCAVVFHTASPFTMTVSDPRKELVDPAKLGTRNVLEQASRTESVRRVVVTSSCAAVYGDNADIAKTRNGRFTEEDWNTSSSLSHQPYPYSKAEAEREAWRIADGQARWDMVTINPSLVVGPGIKPHDASESFSLIRQLGDGTMRSGVPNYFVGAVDVREVADAHIQAADRQQAHGRYIVSGHDTSFPEMARILKAHFGDRYAFPKRTLPKWMVWLVAPMVDKRMTRRIVSGNVGIPFLGDNRKSIRELGITYRSLGESLVEMFEQMIESGQIREAA